MTFSVRLCLLLSAAGPVLAAAQTPPPASLPATPSAAPTAASAAAPEPAPVTLAPYVTTASPLARSQAELTSATTVLDGQALGLRQQATLGETLAGLPGISSSYFGPGASRPVIRGLDSNRVRILQNGIDTIDASSTSPDHAVSVEPFLVKRIEVVRGPAALLYGSAAVGGVVNVIDHRIETELPARPVTGTLESRYDTNTSGYTTGGSVDIALAPDRVKQSGFVAHLDGFRREAGDVRVPGRADVTKVSTEGHIPNTAMESKGGSGGLSYVSPDFNAGLNYNGFDTTYGVPNEPTVAIELTQRRWDFAADLNREFGIFTGARTKFGTADYQHIEMEDGATGTTFTNTGYNGRFELLHAPLAGFTGAFGTEVGLSDFSAIGEEAYLPTNQTQNYALFVFEEAKTGAFTWQTGARYESRTIEADTFNSVLGTNYAARSDERDTLSLSGGVIRTLTPAYALALNLTHTTRAPNAQELYADGPHIATAAYEVGDANLADERALGAELSLRKTKGFMTGALTAFATQFNDYIYLNDTGSIVDLTPLDLLDDEELPEFRFIQRDARFYGVELETAFHLIAETRHTLDLRINADHTRAQETNGPDLPRIAPIKGLIALDWTRGPWSAGTDVQLAASQNHRAPGETPTDGYALLGVSLGYRLETRFAAYDFFVRGSNLTDESARNATSFANIKDIAPLPGRAVTFGVRASF
jgi:iron complex outermembrane receptor protein